MRQRKNKILGENQMKSVAENLLVPRRKLLLGAAAVPLATPFVARAADPIRIGVLLAKTGQIAAQTEYLANGTFLAMEQRNNTINGQPAMPSSRQPS